MYSISNLMSGTQSSASSSKAIGGMATGLDTATLIKNMTASTRSKIARQKQTKQLLSWQTDAYRGISDKLVEFSKKYTSYSSSTNLLSSSFYTKTSISTAGSNSDKVSVTGSSSMTDNMTIVSAEKATAGGAMSSKENFSNTVLTGDPVDFSNNLVSTVGGSEISINYNNVNYKIAFDGTKYNNNADFVSDISSKLSNISVNGSSEKLSDIVNFSLSGDKVTISAKQDGKNFDVAKFSSELKSALGFDDTQFVSDKMQVTFATPKEAASNVGNLTKKVDLADGLGGKYITFSFNNTSRAISFSKTELQDARQKDVDGNDIKDGSGNYIYDQTKIKSMFQTKLDSAFGKDSVKVDFDTNKLKFTTTNTGAVFKVAQIDPSAEGILGISKGDSNRVNLDAAITLPSSPILNINGTPIDLNGVSTTRQLMDKINSSSNGITVSYIESLDRFEFKSSASSDVSINGNVADQFFVKNPGDSLNVKAPTQSKITIKYGDGSPIELTSNNNTFSVDGLSINVNESFSTGDPVKLSAKTDSDKMLTVIKDMVKDYNDIVTLVNKEYSTKPNRNYPPLTDDQRKDMSESEIKAWEDKAKTGMLFGNNDMSSLSNDLRNIFFSTKENMSALNAIGITSSSNWKDNGKIMIDEEKLKKAIESDPENVKDLFSKPLENKKDASGNNLIVNGAAVADTRSGGIMARMKFMMDKYAKTEGSTKGILIEKAGHPSAPLSISKNTILDKMDRIDTIIKNLNRTLSTEEKRFQKQFTALETAYSKLNAQTGWLNQS